MKRQLRKIAGRWLRPLAPPFVRQAWGKRLYGYGPSSSRFRLENDEAAGTLVFSDDASSIHLRLPPATRTALGDLVRLSGKVREEWQALMLETRSHRVLFDIGSFDATEAMLFCKADGANRAILFEPSGGPMRGLDEKLAANGLTDQVTVRTVAIGDKNERRQMYVGPDDMFEIVEAAGVVERNVEPTFVQFRRLDDECRELNLAPDLIRMDVDACEFDVMRGGEQTITSHKPTIIMEVHHDLLERRGQKARDIVEFLDQRGYAFFSCLNEPLRSQDVFDVFDSVTNIVARPR